MPIIVGIGSLMSQWSMQNARSLFRSCWTTHTSMLLLRPRPRTSETIFPRPAAAMVEMCSVDPSELSILSPGQDVDCIEAVREREGIGMDVKQQITERASTSQSME